KDLIAVQDVRLTAGSKVLSDYVAHEDAAVVELLRKAGAVIIGKTNTHEFAYGTYTPPTRNPWDLSRIPGGSSGGSAAALAAGMCLGAIGSDTGGSIRIPAACCGVTGLKPTYGLVPIDGVFPLAPSFDHAGPMARDVAGCSELMRALVPGFTVDEVSLDDLSLAVAWGEVPVRGTPVEFPTAEAVGPAFMREVGDVHRGLYPEHAEL